MNSLITLDKASFGYRQARVLDRVSLDVRAGEFVGLVGPNGAGKSTLFRGILKLMAPQSGTVTHAPVLEGRVGYVPQRDQLDAIYPLTAHAVARMAAAGNLPWYRPAGRDVDARVDASLARVGMAELSRRAFAELSGGQRQRVLIARALAMDPALLVLDEPTAGIDPVAEQSILALLGELNRTSGITILMVSHNLESLRAHVHRVFLVKGGRVEAGTPAELLRPERLMDSLSATL